MQIYQQLLSFKASNKKAVAILIDPDKVSNQNVIDTIKLCNENKVGFIFIGGSLMTKDRLASVVKLVKEYTDLPIVLFPGNNLYLDDSADALLFLSLLSGRNAEYLIGQHVTVAPMLKSSPLEVIPTAYLLVDGGKPTSVTYMSNTNPIPANKGDIAMCTALAGELLGMKLVYMDAGSGAINEVPKAMIEEVSGSVNIPLIVGGGIDSKEKVKVAFEAGADVVVIGTKVESDKTFIQELSSLI